MGYQLLQLRHLIIVLFSLATFEGFAQLSHQDRNMKPFDAILLVDNQTVFVPEKRSFELELQQRFGTLDHGARDLFGLYASSNTRLGAYYVPVKNLMVGTGLTREGMQLALELKYVIIPQNIFPFSASYFMNSSIKLEEDKHIHSNNERLSFFNQLLIARKMNERLTLQIAPSWSHFNKIEQGSPEEPHDTATLNHFALSALGQFHISNSLSIISEYDQPLTSHHHANPHPNLSFGIAVRKGNYAFQVFIENYHEIDSQHSNMFNSNDFRKGQFLFGFNLSRSWHDKKRR